MNGRYWEWRKRRIAKQLAEKIVKDNTPDLTGFCMGQYDLEKCFDCPTEQECMDMIREGARRGN